MCIYIYYKYASKYRHICPLNIQFHIHGISMKSTSEGPRRGGERSRALDFFRGFWGLGMGGLGMGWGWKVAGSWWNLMLVGGLVAINFIFPYIGLLIIPIDELIFFRGVGIQPPTSDGTWWKLWNWSRVRLGGCLFFLHKNTTRV